MPSEIDLSLTLPQICIDFFSLVIQLRVTGQYEDCGTLFKKVQLILDAIDFQAKQNNLLGPDVEDAKYALCALFDQLILTSDCPFKDEWSSRPLELKYFGKNIAGLEFFNKLEKLRSVIETRGQVAEIYYYCLVLGFEGKFRLEGTEKLRLLIESLALDLKRLHYGDFEDLSVQWELPRNLMQKVASEIPVWLVGVAGLALVFLVFTLFRSLLGSESSRLVSELTGIFTGLFTGL